MGRQLDARSASLRRPVLAAACGLAAVTALAACTSGGAGTPQPSVPNTSASSAAPAAEVGTSSTPSARAPQPAKPAVISTVPVKRSSINPTDPISVAVAGGRLTGVKLVNSAGKTVSGALSTDATSWKATEVLGYGKTYTLAADAVNPDGKATKKTERFSTLTPSNMTMPYLQRIGGYPLGHGATYGVAIVPVVHFDEPIGDKAAAEKALKVTSSPHVDGSWYWADDQDVHYRPKSYWPSGTKVTVAADVYGVKVGPGLYGESDVSTSFRIGRKQITIADDNAPKVDKVRVYGDGRLLRTMNTSMGEHSGVTVNGNFINFYTMGGTYTVLDHENPARMCSASYGLPANAPGGYPCENIYYSTKVSIDGIYLHELDNTVWAQDSGVDVSHGCLNLDKANAVWFFDHSIPGDPVVVHGAKGAPTIQVWEGGDWSVPWSKWVAGSALH